MQRHDLHFLDRDIVVTKESHPQSMILPRQPESVNEPENHIAEPPAVASTVERSAVTN